jgi:predicted Zn-ribbon and HTH transcriptional regulator
MKTTKRLGIWMDHSTANLIEFTDDKTETTEIEAQVGEQDEPLNPRDETMIQNKEQNELSDYYKRISEVIKDYDEVLLFGPTHAKDELNNILKDDRHFDAVKIEIKPADNMTENQQQAFVKEHFNIAG